MSCGAHVVIEVAVQAQDVGVAQVRLDLNLPPQLVLHLVLLQLRFVQRLQQYITLTSGRMTYLALSNRKGSQQGVKAKQMMVLGIVCL